MKKIVALVPIWKGSQRVKNKNFKSFCGKNLLIHKIITLKKIKNLDDIIINTDSDKAISIAKKFSYGKANLILAIPDLWIDVQTLLDLDEVAYEFKRKKKRLLRVASKYPNLTRTFLYSKGVTQFQLVQSLGSTEVSPFTGTAEIISDITSTGATLKANNLRILKDGEILKSQACMMVSKLSSKKKEIRKLLNLLSK